MSRKGVREERREGRRLQRMEELEGRGYNGWKMEVRL
jgi:hypothetical protein